MPPARVARFASPAPLGGLLAVAAVCALAAPARAGPPLATEDPNLVPPGQVELIVAATALRESDRSEYATPLVDLTAGLWEGVELALTLPWVQADPAGAGGRAGLGLATAALKTRLAGGPARAGELAFAPSLLFDVSSSSEEREVVTGGTTGILPVVAEWRWGGWRVGGEVRAEVVSGARDRWRGGLYLGREWGERVELLGEVRAGARWDGDRSVVAWRLGMTWRGPGDAQLLLAAGRSAATEAPRRRRLEAFVGVLVPFGR